MSSYSSSLVSRTRIGWSTPTSRIDDARLDMASSSKRVRGCRGLGLMLVIGTTRRAESLSRASVGMSAPRPLPSPLRRATTDLLG